MKLQGAMGSLVPFIPISESVGLIEKRLAAHTTLNMSDNVSFVGDFNHQLSDALDLDYDVDGHLNHGNDPAADTLNLSSSVSLVRDLPRGLTSNLGLGDYAHVVLEGFHGPSSEHSLTANETISAGQPVYVSGNNTVNLADASSTSTANAIGFATTSASANEAVIVLTEGSVTLVDWTAITGLAALVPGVHYYLSETAGMMSPNPPTSDEAVVTRLGIALTTTKFDIEVNEVAIL